MPVVAVPIRLNIVCVFANFGLFLRRLLVGADLRKHCDLVVH